MIGGELRSLSSSLGRKKPLKDLLEMDNPQTETRGGGVHEFDEDELKKVADFLDFSEYRFTKLPIYLYVDLDLDCYYVKGEMDAKVIKKLGEMGNGYQLKNNKLYVPKSIGRKIRLDHPSLVQFFWML